MTSGTARVDAPRQDDDADFDADLGRSVEIDPGRWRRRELPQQLLEQAMHRIRPWL